MLVITDLKKKDSTDFVALTEKELLILGASPFIASLVGAGLGAVGGGLGAAAGNIAAGKSPLDVSTAAGAIGGAATGFFNPVAGAGAAFTAIGSSAVGGVVTGAIIRGFEGRRP